MSALQNPRKGSSGGGRKNRGAVRGSRGGREQAPGVDFARHDSAETAYQGAAPDEWAESSAAPKPDRRPGWTPNHEKGSSLQEEIGDIDPADDDDEENDDEDEDDDDDDDEEGDELDGDDDEEDNDDEEDEEDGEDEEGEDKPAGGIETSARGRDDKPLRVAAKLDGGNSRSSRRQQGRSTIMAKKGSTQGKSGNSKKGGPRKKEETQQSAKPK